MTKKAFFTIIILFLIAIGLGVTWYWFMFIRETTNDSKPIDISQGVSFSPINTSTRIPTPQNTPPQSTTTSNIQIQTSQPYTPPRIRLIRREPVATGVLSTTTPSEPGILFVDRGQGHVLFQGTETPTYSRLTNTSILRTYKAFWNNTGSEVIMSFLKESTVNQGEMTYVLGQIQYAPTNTSSTSTNSTSTDIFGTIRGTYFPANTLDIAVSPQRTNIVTLERQSIGVIAYTSTFDGNNKKKVFQSPLRGWNISWPTNQTILFNTKASAHAPGIIYSYNTQTGATALLTEPANALVGLLSSSGANIALGYIDPSSSYVFEFMNMSTKNRMGGVFRTLPDKCVWAHKKEVVYCGVPQTLPVNAPDTWYTGEELTADNLWRVDMVTGESRLISRLFDDTGELIDIYNPEISPNDLMLYFVNKRDNSFWSIELPIK